MYMIYMYIYVYKAILFLVSDTQADEVSDVH